MTPGSVVFFKDFTFHDGDHADKFLIVLNDGNKRPYLVLKTTSRQKSRPNKEGCHSAKGCYFLPAKRKKLFAEHPPAWVLPLTWRPNFLEGRGKSPTMDFQWTVWLAGDTDTKYRLLGRETST